MVGLVDAATTPDIAHHLVPKPAAGSAGASVVNHAKPTKTGNTGRPLGLVRDHLRVPRYSSGRELSRRILHPVRRLDDGTHIPSLSLCASSAQGVAVAARIPGVAAPGRVT